jgi:hypothetical protein
VTCAPSPLRALAALSLALGLAPRSLRADEPAFDGPLGLRTQGVLRELFLDSILLDARPSDALEVDLRWAAANDWSIPTEVARFSPLQVSEIWTDEQADSLTARVRIPWSRFLRGGPRDLWGSARPLWARLSTAFEWRLTEHWGGWSDGSIGSFHAFIGGFDYDRNLYPANQVSLFLGDLYGGPVAFNLHSATLAPGDLVARNQFLLAEQPWGDLALRLDVKAPTGSLARAGSSGGWDAGLGLAGTFPIAETLTLHAMATLSMFSNFSTPIDLQPKRFHFTFEGSFVWRLGPVYLLIEDRCLSPLLEPGWQRLEFGGDNGLISSAMFASFRTHNQVSAGVRWREFSFWLSEDYTPGSNPRSVITFVYVSNSPDIVAGLSWTKRF